MKQLPFYIAVVAVIAAYVFVWNKEDATPLKTEAKSKKETEKSEPPKTVSNKSRVEEPKAEVLASLKREAAGAYQGTSSYGARFAARMSRELEAEGGRQHYLASNSWVSDPSDPNNVIIEAAIRKKLREKLNLKKLTIGLTNYDLGYIGALNLNSNKLTDVTGLEELRELTWLALDDNQLTDVKGLEKLTELRVLLLYNNQLTDVKVLEQLTNLRGLDLEDNPDLTKTQIDELQKALPKCRIFSNPKK